MVAGRHLAGMAALLAVRYAPKNTAAEQTIALVIYSMPGKQGSMYRFDQWTRVRGCNGAARATWSCPSRVDPLAGDMALWVYPLPGPGDALRDTLQQRRRYAKHAA